MNANAGEWNCLKSQALGDPHGGSIYELAQRLLCDPDNGFSITGQIEQTVVETRREIGPSFPPPLADQAEAEVGFQRLKAGNTAGAKRVLATLTRAGIRAETWQRLQWGVDATGVLVIPVRATADSDWCVLRHFRYLQNGGKKLHQTSGAFSMIYPIELLQEKPQLPVLVTEGETDMALANQESDDLFVAVTGTGGASNPPRELAPLDGREVFIAYDTDDSGIKGAQKLAAQLRKRGRAKVFILDLQKLGLPHTENKGADLSDYLQQFDGTAEKLHTEMERLRSSRPEKFKTVSAAELAMPVPPMTWLVKGVWPEGSFGTLAGEKKTLKTYTALALALAVASGEPFLGKFPVPQPRPVLMYLGEGGKSPTMRRVQRLAEWMEIDLASLPLRMVFDSGDITGDEFRGSLDRAVEEQMPGLVIVDPFYAFHPAGVEAQNLYDRGAVLAEISSSMPPGCAFVLADHFRKTGGKDLDLDSIAQSGVSAWADSWILQNHAETARVDTGDFYIGMQFGSRQWGGQQYVVDWAIGSFNADTGEHDGHLSADVRSVSWGAKPASGGQAVNSAAGELVLALLEQQPLTHTFNSAQTQVKQQISIGSAKFKGVWDALVAEELIISEKVLGMEGPREVERERWRLKTAEERRIVLSKVVPE